MSTIPGTDGCTDFEPTQARFDVELSEEDDVEPAPNADVCGALGCRNSDDLRFADHPRHGQRVVCPRHHREITEDAG